MPLDDEADDGRALAEKSTKYMYVKLAPCSVPRGDRRPDRSSSPVCFASRLEASKGRRVLGRSEVNAKDAGAGTGRERNDRDIFHPSSSVDRVIGGGVLRSGLWLDSGRQRCVALRCVALRARAPPPPGTAVVVPRIVSQLVCSSYCIGLVVVVQPATDRAPPGRTLHAALAFARARVINDRIVGGEQHGPG
jgi:hypothetical protein